MLTLQRHQAIRYQHDTAFIEYLPLVSKIILEWLDDLYVHHVSQRQNYIQYELHPIITLKEYQNKNKKSSSHQIDNMKDALCENFCFQISVHVPVLFLHFRIVKRVEIDPQLVKHVNWQQK
jgi:hypothetical protein